VRGVPGSGFLRFTDTDAARTALRALDGARTAGGHTLHVAFARRTRRPVLAPHLAPPPAPETRATFKRRLRHLWARALYGREQGIEHLRAQRAERRVEREEREKEEAERARAEAARLAAVAPPRKKKFGVGFRLGS
jgi:hypothetical protein